MPYPTNFRFIDKNHIPINFTYGAQRKSKKAFSIKIFDHCTEIYQPIILEYIKNKFKDSNIEKYINSFYQENTFTNSKVFMKKDGIIQQYSKNESYTWIPNTLIGIKKVNDIPRAIFKLQNHIIQNHIEHKTYFKNGEKDNYVDYYTSLIKSNKLLMKNKVIVQDPKNPNRYCSKALLDS